MVSQSPSSAPSTAPSALPGWTIPVQMAVSLLLTAGLFFMLGRWSRESADPAIAARAESGPSRLDVNRASSADLRLLPGVGAALAQRIVAQRPFRNVDELRLVSGVGPKTLERLRPWLFVEGEAEQPVALRAEPAKVAVHTRKPAPTSAVDVNVADVAELQKLPGIGPKLSQRVVDERTLRGPFKSVDELRRVAGIGAKTLERLRPYVTVDADALQVARTQ